MKARGSEGNRNWVLSVLLRACYDLKCSTVGLFWVYTAFAFITCLLVLETNLDLAERQLRLALSTEVIAPVILGFYANSLLMSEIESRSAVFPASRRGLPSLWSSRLAALFFCYLLVLATVLITVNLFHSEIGFIPFAAASLPICLFMACLISFFGFFIKEMNAGYLAGTFMWALNFVGAKAALGVFGPNFYPFYWWASFKYSFAPEALWTNKANFTLAAIILYLFCIQLLHSKYSLLRSK